MAGERHHYRYYRYYRYRSYRSLAVGALGVLFVAVFGVAPVSGVTLDWNSVNWSSGSLSQSFDIDASNPGNDITITIAEINGGNLADPVNDSNFLTGGQGSSQESLYIAADHPGSSSNAAIRVVIDFNYALGVRDVDFSIFDVDNWRGQWRDQVKGFKGKRNGSNVSVATLTSSSYNNVNSGGTAVTGKKAKSGDPDDIYNADPDESLGNVGVDFGSMTVDQVKFVWTNKDSAEGFQYIALYDINYTPVIPEGSAIWAAVGLLVFFTGYRVVQEIFVKRHKWIR